jgi:hypothetical protein
LKEKIANQPRRKKHQKVQPMKRRLSVDLGSNLGAKEAVDYMEDHVSSEADSGTSSKAMSVAYDEKPETAKSRAKSMKKVNPILPGMVKLPSF